MKYILLTYPLSDGSAKVSKDDPSESLIVKRDLDSLLGTVLLEKRQFNG